MNTFRKQNGTLQITNRATYTSNKLVHSRHYQAGSYRLTCTTFALLRELKSVAGLSPLLELDMDTFEA